MRDGCRIAGFVIVGTLLSASAAQETTITSTAGAQTHEVSFFYGGLKRHYRVDSPAKVLKNQRLPLVVFLHGGGGCSRQAAEDLGWTQKAVQEKFLVVYPDGIARDPSQPSAFRGNPQTWNDGSGRFAYKVSTPPDDVAFLDALIDQVVADYACDTNRIYMTGFSNGASMTFSYALKGHRRVAAIAPVAGVCWPETVQPSCPIPLCYVTGTEDPLNPLDGGKPWIFNLMAVKNKSRPPTRHFLQAWIGADKCQPQAAAIDDRAGKFRVEQYRGDAENCDVRVVYIYGQGHAWSGGQERLPRWLVGRQTNAFATTDYLWAFFAAHSIR